MTSIAAPTAPGTAGQEQHPAWCAMNGVNIGIPCGNHLGEPAHIPATDSDFRVCDAGALFPRVEVAAATVDGQIAVSVGLTVPTGVDSDEWAAVCLLPADARTFAADLAPVGKGAVAADIAGTELSATVRAIGGGWVSAVTDGGSVRLTICDKAREITLEAFLKPDEVASIVFALAHAADVVEGQR